MSLSVNFNLKWTVVLISFLAFNLAEACPDLTGVYLCKQNSYRTDTHYSFERVSENGAWHFRMQAQNLEGKPLSVFEFTADGVERELIDGVTGQRLKAQAKCNIEIENGLLTDFLNVEGSAQGPQGQTIRFVEKLRLSPQSNLMNTSLDIFGNWFTETCDRVNP